MQATCLERSRFAELGRDPKWFSGVVLCIVDIHGCPLALDPEKYHVVVYHGPVDICDSMIKKSISTWLEVFCS
jgi:hypothetical protein